MSVYECANCRNWFDGAAYRQTREPLDTYGRFLDRDNPGPRYDSTECRTADEAKIRDRDHAAAIVEDGYQHDPEPHSRRPSECRTCGRRIVSTYDDGRRTSSRHVEPTGTKILR
jgi:ribosomal protein L37AE/L43A